MPMRSTLLFWTVLLITTTASALLAMFGAKRGAQWRNMHNTCNQTMRLAR
jgi:hypothetical protein